MCNIKELLTSISVDIRISLPDKMYFLYFLRVDKSLCLQKLKSVNVLLYDFFTINAKT